MTTTLSRSQSRRGICNFTVVVLICPCGYSTRVTRPDLANNAMRRHRRLRHQPVQLELPFDLPEPAAAAVTGYLAQRRCWRHGDTYIDMAAVRRFLDGDHHVPLSPLERVAVYTLLRRRGESANRCARLLRLSWATQARYRRLLVDQVA